MLSRNIFHALLTLLLLFGQFSTLAHALEHLSFTENSESCLNGKISQDTDNFPGHVQHDTNHRAHGHHGQVGNTPDSGASCTQNAENSEPDTCLIYHLHGNTQCGFNAELAYTEFYSHLGTVRIRKTDVVIPVFIALYDSRGPPAATLIA